MQSTIVIVSRKQVLSEMGEIVDITRASGTSYGNCDAGDYDHWGCDA
jgi:hypothetical protein